MIATSFERSAKLYHFVLHDWQLQVKSFSFNDRNRFHLCKHIVFLAIAVVINRLNLPSVTVGVDGTLFRHHEKFKKNLTRTLSRLVPRTVSVR